MKETFFQNSLEESPSYRFTYAGDTQSPLQLSTTEIVVATVAMNRRMLSTRAAICFSRRSFHRLRVNSVPPVVDNTSETPFRNIYTTKLQGRFLGGKIWEPSPLDENYFLRQVEATVANVLGSQQQQQRGGNVRDLDISNLPTEEREAVGIAKALNKRLRLLRKNNDCPRCWLPRHRCICQHCGPADPNDSSNLLRNLKTIYVVFHHKEIGMKIDTAKLILAAFPFRCELVVGGIGPNHQASMQKLMDTIYDTNRTTLLLYPDDSAKTLKEVVGESSKRDKANTNYTEYDLIVLDGTWAQARKFHSRYFPAKSLRSLQRIKLSEASVKDLQDGSIQWGHQLRKHEISWRQVGTFEAFRLFLKDWFQEFPLHHTKLEEGNGLEPWEQIEPYQNIANKAALGELPLPTRS